jgi:HSP20 family protein
MYNITNKQNENNLMEAFNDLVNDFYSKDMKTNIVDEGDYYLLTSDVAGYKKEDIDIKFTNNILTIKALNNKTSENKNYLIKERLSHEVTRKFVFDDVDSNSIKAKINDGILEITLSKAKKEDKNKYITIE